jgi:branched-subunit amino acid aminotransferase/4-amino-4-deoxychorismate lyase
LASGLRLRPVIAQLNHPHRSLQGGDAVWEGLRVYNGKVFHLEQHLQRLMDSAKAMDFKSACVFDGFG